MNTYEVKLKPDFKPFEDGIKDTFIQVDADRCQVTADGLIFEDIIKEDFWKYEIKLVYAPGEWISCRKIIFDI